MSYRVPFQKYIDEARGQRYKKCPGCNETLHIEEFMKRGEEQRHCEACRMEDD